MCFVGRRSCEDMVRHLTALKDLNLRAFSGAEPGCARVISLIGRLPALEVSLPPLACGMGTGAGQFCVVRRRPSL